MKTKTELDYFGKSLSAIEAEQSILGGLMSNNKSFYKISEFLLPKHFYDTRHAKIFEVCAKLIMEGKIADPLTVKAHFEEKMEEIGGQEYLINLLKAAGLTAIVGIEDYARLVLDYYKSRELFFLSENIQSDISEHPTEFNRVFEDYSGGIMSLADLRVNKETAISDIFSKGMEEIEKKMRGEINTTDLKFGIESLDSVLGGIFKRRLYVVAGRPGMGKSAFSTSVAILGLNKGYKIGFISLEMTSEEIVKRMQSIESGIQYWRIDGGKVSKDEFYKLNNTKEKFKNLSINDNPTQTIISIRAIIQKWKIQKNVDIVFIDHIGLCDATDKKINRAYQIEEITKGLKVLAKEFDIAIFALVQINRAVEARENKRPTLSDLRDSGAIEQDSDIVMLIYRKEYYLERLKPDDDSKLSSWQIKLDDARGKAEIIIDKNRQGRNAVVDLFFDKQFMQFK